MPSTMWQDGRPTLSSPRSCHNERVSEATPSMGFLDVEHSEGAIRVPSDPARKAAFLQLDPNVARIAAL